MKNIFKAILAVGISLGSFSCTSFLDMTPTDSVSDKLIWETTENAEYHVNYIYSYTYDVLMNQCVAGQTEALTEQLKYGSYNYNSLCYISSEIAYGVDQTLSAGYVDAYLGYWGSWYQGIAKCNKALDCLKRFGQMSDEDKVRLEAEIKRVEGKLNNPGFVSKAPKTVVDEERAKGEQYKDMLQKVLSMIEANK